MLLLYKSSNDIEFCVETLVLLVGTSCMFSHVKIIQTFVIGCAKPLYLQKWHRSDVYSTCTLDSHLKQIYPNTTELSKNSSFKSSC